MNLKTKILTDKIIGLPLVYTLNLSARILGFFLRIDHSLNKPVKTIAICKFLGLGSIIQATPLLKTLRKKYPEAHIIFITTAENTGLLKHIPSVDSVYTISDKGFLPLLATTISLLFNLWKQRPGIYIDLEIYSNFSSIIATMSLSKNRMGFFKNDKTYRSGIYTHMLFFNIKAPISQAYLQFARLLGGENMEHELSLNSKNIAPDTLQIICQKLKTELNKYMVVNPNASDLRTERRWDSVNFISLIKKIRQGFPEHNIILIGAENETAYVKRLSSELISEKNVIDSSGKLSIAELMLLIENAELMITNDTGPMHIAFAMKTRTVSLFGPCSPQQYRGLNNSTAIYKNTYCSPCVHDFLIPPCKGDNQCMKKITVDEVYEAVKLSLEDIPPKGAAQNPAMDYTGQDNFPLGVISR